MAVLDGIVLINHLNELKNKGLTDLHERIREATKNRLRPVTVTSALIDYNITIGQNLGNPLQNIKKNKAAQIEIEIATNEKKYIEQRIKFELSNTYYFCQMLHAKKTMLKTLLSDFEKVTEIAELQYNTGEANYLS